MFRWTSLFGVRYDQAKTRRAKKTVTLRLEALEDRTVPSTATMDALPFQAVASPPPVPSVASLASPAPAPSMAAITSYVFSTMDHWFQIVATAEQDFLGDLSLVSQEFAQIESSFQQQMGRIFGNNPNAANPSLNTTVTPPNSGMGRGNSRGSGSGSSASTTHNPPNQPLNNSTQKSGSGSGGGSGSTTTHPIHSTHGTSIHPMTSGTGSGGSGSGSNGSGTGSVGNGTGSGYAHVSGKVWLDNDGDGSWDNGELGYYGIKVDLEQASMQPYSIVQQVTTDAGGNYQFRPILLGPSPQPFFVHVEFQNALTATYYKPNQNQINGAGDSAQFDLRAGGWRQVLAGMLSMTASTTDDDPNQPIQNQVTLRDAIKTGNNGGGPLKLNQVAFYDFQNKQALGGTITLQKELDPIKRSYDIYHEPEAPGLTVNGNNNAGTIFTVNAGVTSTISNLTITGGSAQQDGGGILNMGDLTLYGDTIINNAATGNGGGIYNDSGAQLNLQMVTIGTVGNPNKATGGGGGLYNLGTVTICCGSVIINNSAGGGGGGIYNSEGTIQVFDETEINQNDDSGLRGGGVYNNNGKFQMYGGYIADNKETKSDGGGVYNYFGTMTLTNVAVLGNTAIGYGGGIYTYEGSLTLTNKVSIGSSAQTDTNTALRGGGIYANGSVVKMTGGTITNNTARASTGGAPPAFSGGGGLFVNAGSVTLTNVSISHNGSRVNGGGVFVRSGSLKLIKDIISNNVNLNNPLGAFGAGMFINGGTVTVSEGTFQYNRALSGSGGAIYNYAGSLTLTGGDLRVQILDNFASNNGGGMFLANNSKTTFDGATVMGNKTSLNIQTTGRGVFEQQFATVTINPGGLTDLDDDGGVPYNTGPIT